VALDKTTTSKDGATYVAMSAIGMAISTMVLVSFLHVGVREVRPAGFKDCNVTLQRFVERSLCSFSNLTVASSTFINRVFNYAFVGFFLLLRSSHSTVAANTVIGVVHIFQKTFIH